MPATNLLLAGTKMLADELLELRRHVAVGTAIGVGTAAHALFALLLAIILRVALALRAAMEVQK
jgi:hypothetical protein